MWSSTLCQLAENIHSNYKRAGFGPVLQGLNWHVERKSIRKQTWPSACLLFQSKPLLEEEKQGFKRERNQKRSEKETKKKRAKREDKGAFTFSVAAVAPIDLIGIHLRKKNEGNQLKIIKENKGLFSSWMLSSVLFWLLSTVNQIYNVTLPLTPTPLKRKGLFV